MLVALGDSDAWRELVRGPILPIDVERPAADLIDLLRLSLAGR